MLNEEAATCWREEALLLIDVLEKTGERHMILITSLMEVWREGPGKSEDRMESADWVGSG